MSGIDSPTTGTLREAAHETDVETTSALPETKIRTAKPPSDKRSLHEAAHKIGYWGSAGSGEGDDGSEERRRRFAALADDDRDVIAHAGRAVLVLGALGVVYGDIGTSPLYTEQVIFGSYDATAHVTPATAYGVVSLISWALVVVSIKYAGFIMRAHNRGDGGIMALTALLQRNRVASDRTVMMGGQIAL